MQSPWPRLAANSPPERGRQDVNQIRYLQNIHVVAVRAFRYGGFSIPFTSCMELFLLKARLRQLPPHCLGID